VLHKIIYFFVLSRCAHRYPASSPPPHQIDGFGLQAYGILGLCQVSGEKQHAPKVINVFIKFSIS